MPPQEPLPEGEIQARDLEWMRRVQAGDTEAFRALIQEYQGRVAAGIARMTGSGTDPEEVAHEVFVRVWRSAHRYRPSAKLTTWLFTIARNLVLNEIRYKTRHPTVSRDAQATGPTALSEEPVENAARRPDAVLLDAELQMAIDAALQTPPENQRTAVVLRRYEDLSYEEIALVLEVSVSSVKSLLFRARTTLREALREYLE